MCAVLLPPGVNPIGVNKYIMYHIISLSSGIWRRVEWWMDINVLEERLTPTSKFTKLFERVNLFVVWEIEN